MPTEEGAMPRPELEIVEMSLLLPAWQAVALEAAARCRGLTTAQMLRRIISQMVDQDALVDAPAVSPASSRS
jgi:hypothetical protein